MFCKRCGRDTVKAKRYGEYYDVYLCTRCGQIVQVTDKGFIVLNRGSRVYKRGMAEVVGR